MSARTTVLAAANPVGGHYSHSKTVNENLKMPPALLSRFDIVFIILDQANEKNDGNLADHVLRMHSVKAAHAAASAAESRGSGRGGGRGGGGGGGGSGGGSGGGFSTQQNGNQDDRFAPALSQSQHSTQNSFRGDRGGGGGGGRQNAFASQSSQHREAEDFLASQMHQTQNDIARGRAAAAATPATLRAQRAQHMSQHGGGSGGGRGGRGGGGPPASQASGMFYQPEPQPGDDAGRDADVLVERLQKVANEQGRDPIPTFLLRSYVRYARKYVHPRLSQEAADVLQSFYLKLRGQRGYNDTTPITTRQLEALVRLAQARAKTELREVVSKQDALDVVAIMHTALLDTVTDEHGCIDLTRTSGISGHGKVMSFVNELERRAQQKGDPMFTTPQLSEVVHFLGIELNGEHIRDFAERVNQANYLQNKGGGNWKLLHSKLDSNLSRSQQQDQQNQRY